MRHSTFIKKYILQFGRVNIESSERSKHYASYYEADDHEISANVATPEVKENGEINGNVKSPKANGINGNNNNSMNVIKRDTLLLPAKIKRQASRHLPGDDVSIFKLISALDLLQ